MTVLNLNNFTKSGHYSTSISPCSKILNNNTNGSNSDVTLIGATDRSKRETGLKVHRQFSCPKPEKLIKLLNCAGESWSFDEELIQLIKDIHNICKTWQIYQKPPPEPVVGLSSATSFQEYLAMDLKFY